MGSANERPVLADVARLSGVSVPTVSRVLTGSLPVSEDKRSRVLAAVAELGYVPNAAARALAGGTKSMIGVIALNTSRYGYAKTLEGIEQAARVAGYVVLVAVVESVDPAEVRAAVDLVVGQTVAGVVVIEWDPAGVAVARALPDTLPVVSITSPSPGTSPHPRAHLDDRTGARQATEYLLGLGHRTVHRIALTGAEPRPVRRPRGRAAVDDPVLRPSGRSVGWYEALRDAGAPVPTPIPADAALVAGDTPAAGFEAARRLLDDPAVTAVLCDNDELAIGAMSAFADAGRSVPGDVSVIGFDDQPFAAMWRPALTTVAQDFVDLGQRALHQLDERLQTGTCEPESFRLPRLVVRGSTAPPSSATPAR